MEKSSTKTSWNPTLYWGSYAYEYMIDRTQRTVLFWDVMRKRGNDYLSHLKKGQPTILLFDYDEILDGRTFDKPVNYSLVRIQDRRTGDRRDIQQVTQERRHTQHGKVIDENGLPARPIVVIDPRAGHGPGIGGSKLSSQIGVALDYGHPVYFISFSTDPEPNQTISSVQSAEVRFLEEVASRHPDAPKPAIIGNCQAGWATALVGADRPDVTGPMIFNGSPLSYWGGVEGANPMRYKGGLTGGTWLTSLWSDLGNNIFDGANLVAGFEDLNPANTYWSKYYHLFSNIDTEEKRFLDFEKWWGGFFKMNGEEIHYIVNSLFVGNELEKGHLRLDDGRLIDLKNFKDPILAFASEGDNITPPPQAFNWIYKVYGTVDEIKRCEQVIIYMVHKKVGHLGIFVSSRVAKKEYKQILGNMGWLEYLPPGLYEMVIEDATNSMGLDDYEVRFEERKMEDILELDDGLEDEEPFVAVNNISKFNDAIYRMYVSPWVQAAVSEPVAESLRQLHPLRVQRYTVSDENPFCWPLEWMAEKVVAERKIIESDNPFVQLEDIFSDSMKNSLNFFRDMRDISQEMTFKTLYSSPWINAFWGDVTPSAANNITTDKEQIPIDNREKIRLRKEAEVGGFVEASVRVMLASIAGTDKVLDIRELQAAEESIKESKRLSRVSPATFKQLTREQAKILAGAPRKALTSLSTMVTTIEDKKKLYSIAEKIAHADTSLGENDGKMLDSLKQILFAKNK